MQKMVILTVDNDALDSVCFLVESDSLTFNEDVFIKPIFDGPNSDPSFGDTDDRIAATRDYIANLGYTVTEIEGFAVNIPSEI